jgi:GT2 family glycosyltransferase
VTEPAHHGAADGLTVIIVSYGSPALLTEALAALEGAYPTIVVDNSSSPAAKTVTEEAGARYVDPGANLGYTRAVNLGLTLRSSAEDDVLLLNPDASISPPAVERLRAVLRSGSQVACVAPAQRTPESNQLSPTWWPWHTPGGAWVEAVGLRRLRSTNGFMGGAILLISAAALAQVGPLDERYFMYSDDEDWQRRAVKKGWRLTYCSDVTALHRVGRTDDDLEQLQQRLHSAIERYIRKWYGSGGWAVYRWATVLGYGIRVVVNRGHRRRTFARLARLYLAGPDNAARRSGAVPTVSGP